MGDATMKDYSELAGKVIVQDFPIMPQPRWGQDAAYLGFFIDRLIERNERLHQALIDAGVPEALVQKIANGESS